MTKQITISMFADLHASISFHRVAFRVHRSSPRRQMSNDFSRACTHAYVWVCGYQSGYILNPDSGLQCLLLVTYTG